MFRTVKPLITRMYTLVNATVVLLVLLGILAGLNWGRMPHGFSQFLDIRITIKNAIVSATFLLACAVAFRAFGLSEPSPAKPFWKELLQAAKACTVASVFALFSPLTTTNGAFTVRTVLYFLPAAIVACLCGRFAARAFAEPLAGAIGGRHDLIIVGSGPRALAIYDRIRASRHGDACVLGFVDSPNGHLVSTAIQRQMLGNLDDLETILMKRPVDEVVIALPAKSCYEQIQTAIQTCERTGVEAKYLSDIFQLSLAKPKFEPDENAPTVSLKAVHDDYRLLVKRCIDVVGATVGLIAFGPLMLAIAAAIKLTSCGPVLFTQERFGLHKRPFRMSKFRTMVSNADKSLTTYLKSDPGLEAEWRRTHKLKTDPRITRIGTFLRRTSLDELPQLINVLRGDMSLVGPRPRPIEESELSKYGDCFAAYRQVLPGLTGLWQVSGRSDCSYEMKVKLDNKYVHDWSLWLDACILARTVRAVLSKAGAY